MIEPRYARKIARLLAAQRSTVSDARTTGENRGSVLAAMHEAALRKRARGQVLRFIHRGFAALGVAAAVAVIFIGVSHTLTSKVVSRTVPMPTVLPFVQTESTIGVRARALAGAAALVDPRGETALGDGVAMTAGQRLVTRANGRAALAMQTGSRLIVEPNSDFVLLDASPIQRFLLLGGLMSFEVAHLTREQRFIVSTPDTEVEVRGTKFHVRVADRADACAQSRTRVDVEQGLVTVRHGGATVQVPGGQSWPPPCAPPSHVHFAARSPNRGVAVRTGRATSTAAPPTIAPKPIGGIAQAGLTPNPSVAAVTQDFAITPSSPAVTAAQAHPPPSSLREQNDLFARAMAAKARGNAKEALAELDLLLARFPRGPLVEASMGERMRLLASSGAREAAVSAARAYTQRFPRGFARAEADALRAP